MFFNFSANVVSSRTYDKTEPISYKVKIQIPKTKYKYLNYYNE
jgi:hypothetical protein